MIKALKGTKDTLPSDMPKWKVIENLVAQIMSNYNYKEIRTPVFEETALFCRGIGESTDIVSKEMYTFLDQGKTSLTLKPEMTASVVRSLLEHSLDKQQGLNKLYYISSMFRQERPQAGRYRQFNQFGAEALGSNNPALDAEMILMAYSVISGLGLKNLVVKINSLGILESREKYKNILRDFLSDKVEQLSEDSRKRYDSNVLRIFDSKVEADQKIMENAPLLIDYLDEESLEHFNQVKNILDAAKIPYEVDPILVRGLDYYTHTTFEVISGSVGSQAALCGGGRYNLLVKQLGDRDVPGVGFAAGIERILLACENEGCLEVPEESIDLYIIRLSKEPEFETKVAEFAHFFREKSLSVEHDYLSRSVKAQMREANKLNAKYTIIVGGDEYEQGKVVFKNMKDSEQAEFSINELDKISESILT